MPTVGHPSALSPALPRIELTLPDGWVAEPGGDALLRAVHGRGGDLAPELTAYVHTTRGASTDDLVDDLASQADGHEEGEAEETFTVEIGERDWTGLNVSWIEDGEPVYLVHLVTAVPAGDVTQLVRLTGRIAGPDSEQDYEDVQSILETVQLDPMGGGA
ncbi:hypothetical protein GCM10022415_12430 [Knoellia locipacati]|uniref:Uncharacterized protein n=1 Tax=Knoellia locipacati TaxID=882824 RepID=A0A512SZ54_9MICO|nr:hypothetical protein [Knoellia locipacati]GEQ13193.1 hypothetical protein KLO01_12400 [Knoellia locipacati]